MVSVGIMHESLGAQANEQDHDSRDMQATRCMCMACFESVCSCCASTTWLPRVGDSGAEPLQIPPDDAAEWWSACGCYSVL